jgi:general secretion pathway protein A
MYNKFFGLAEAPFNITPDSRFLFLSQRHKEALSAMLYGIRERKGFILLTGEIGSGKTTICRALVNELRQDNVKLSLILNPGLSELELLKAINDEFQIPSFYDTKKGLVDALNQFLIRENQQGSNVVLIIDEAQNLDPSLLEQIRLLSNLETENDKLIQILLIGQPELNETMRLAQLEQLNQRISVRFHITPLSESEMYSYIKHRLFVARAKVDIEFTDGALKLAYASTRGIPRKINVLMDRALLACYVEGSYTVDEKIMLRAVQEVAGDEPRLQKPQKTRRSLKAVSGALLTRKTAIIAGATAATLALVTVAVAVGVRLANVQAIEESSRPTGLNGTAAAAAIGKQAAFLKKQADEHEKDDTSNSLVPEDESTGTASAAPKPTPNWNEIRRNNPNWKYEKNVPLVRVNNPRAAHRAAQLSMLKMWGIAVDLTEMAKLGEDLILNGEMNSDRVKIYSLPIEAKNFYEAARYNIPLIVKQKNVPTNQSEYVVLLRAEGEAVTVGDPVWGVKTYKLNKFLMHWDSASVVFVDVNQLGSIQKGDKGERVRALQAFLKSQKYLSDETGVFDVKTVEAIRKFQSFYEINESGKLDPLTIMLLNSQMMSKGPHLVDID